MRLRTFTALTSVCVVALAGLGACGETTATNTPTLDPGKADCPDCDIAGPNAFIQTDVGDGFYAKGDSWQVAYRFNFNGAQEKRDEVLAGDRAVESEAFLFDYVVLSTDAAVFNTVKRETVTIEVTQGTASGTNGDLFAQGRLDRFEHKAVFRMNDLLDPISETIFNRNYPNGKLIQLDSASALKTGASIFPRTIPRLLVNGGIASPAPALPADLRDIVDAYDASWSEQSYLKYSFDNGDVVYWSKGRGPLWPFYVATSAGAGVLLGWN